MVRVFLVFCGLIAFSSAAFVDTLEKCKTSDKECLKKVVKGALDVISTNGIPEYDVPPVDPLELKNMKFNLMNLADLTIIDGTLHGVKGCEINDIAVELEAHTVDLDLTCDLTAKGQYEVSGSTPALQNIFGSGALKGTGNAELSTEKLGIHIKFIVEVVKRDGETYVHCNKDKVDFDFDLQGDSHLSLDNLYIGDKESSKTVTDYYNQNAKTLWKTFGKNFLSSATKFAFDTISKFFEKAPSKFYIADDLTPYVN